MCIQETAIVFGLIAYAIAIGSITPKISVSMMEISTRFSVDKWRTQSKLVLCSIAEIIICGAEFECNQYDSTQLRKNKLLLSLAPLVQIIVEFGAFNQFLRREFALAIKFCDS